MSKDKDKVKELEKRCKELEQRLKYSWGYEAQAYLDGWYDAKNRDKSDPQENNYSLCNGSGKAKEYTQDKN